MKGDILITDTGKTLWETMRDLAVAHYDRMIDRVESWTSEQKEKVVNFFILEDDLGEDWSADYCDYCKEFIDNDCKQCPLVGEMVDYNEDREQCASCCNYLWSKMNNSTTWTEWIEKAKAVRDYIQLNGIGSDYDEED